MRRSPDERLRTAADCLSRLRGLGPDPKSIPRERHNIGVHKPEPLFEDGPGPVLEPVGGEFQPSFETVHPGGGAYLFPYYILFSCLISNFKHQISMKSQISISNDPNRFVILNFGHCDLFVIWYLRFGIFHRNVNVSSSIKLDACGQRQC